MFIYIRIFVNAIKKKSSRYDFKYFTQLSLDFVKIRSVLAREKKEENELSAVIYFHPLMRTRRGELLRAENERNRWLDISSPDTGNTTFEDIEKHDA